MQINKTLLTYMISFACLTPCFAQADLRVVILRHGEKPAAGLGQLDCQGLNRALALGPVLQKRFGMPTAIYAPNPTQLKQDKGIEYAYIRPLATIEPFAIRSGLPVNLGWGMTDVKALAAYLQAEQGTHVVAWEHHLAVKLARTLMEDLGGDREQVPKKWADDDFDSLYVITVTGNNPRQVQFSHETEGLNTLPQTCP